MAHESSVAIERGSDIGVADSARSIPVPHPSSLDIQSQDELWDPSFVLRSYSHVFFAPKLNDCRYVNKTLERLNEIMDNGAILEGWAISNGQRRRNQRRKFGSILAVFIATADFFVNRIAPKSALTKRLYFSVTKGKNRPLAHTEIVGRLISCGFDIVELNEHQNRTKFKVVKQREPEFNFDVTYGPMISLIRVGKNGKHIKVYKLRTMHPYSEYVQNYMYQTVGLADSGKIRNDIRVTAWGKFLRRFWLDEIPMVINVLKGDLKIMGVRPISPHYLSLYPEEFAEFRSRFKPGLIPPFYADLPDGFDEIVESERKYLNSFSKRPIKTDIHYLARCLVNIFINGARSS